MSVELLVVILIAFMIVASLIAVETEDLLSSVIAVGAAGFALSVIDLLLGAPDLAVTQVVVEIVAVVILIRLIVTRTDTARETPRDTLRTALVLLACGVLLAGGLLALGSFASRPEPAGTVPAFGRPVLGNQPTDPVPPGVGMDYLRRADAQTGAANAVMAVLLDYRGYDTLGEATIIFVAVLGVYAILRRVGRKRASPGCQPPPGSLAEEDTP